MIKTTKIYKDCHRCYGQGRMTDIDDSGIIDGTFRAFFGGLQVTCNICKGSGRIEETIEE
ncbi:MAG: hypothetical protein KJI69_05035 [Patescibacteria group bacterium]|nr:hypothetical protein [Patescibacteria group bacterium]